MQYVSQKGPNIQAPKAKGIHIVKWGLGKAWLDKENIMIENNGWLRRSAMQ